MEVAVVAPVGALEAAQVGCAAWSDEMVPFRLREMAAVLSLRVARVRSRRSKVVLATSAWASTPACSRSLLVMSP